MRRFLAPAGFLIITSPGPAFPEHRFPRDYWRFLPDAYREIFFEGLTVLEHRTTADPCECWLGRKEQQ